MTCCDSEKKTYPRTAICPVNGHIYKQVSRKTLLNQVGSPRNEHLQEQGWYFCTSPDCDVVYFSMDGDVITRSEARRDVGQKSDSPYRTLCYCFDISAGHVDMEIKRDGYSASYEFVVEQTGAGNCACEVQNPSGRCCLKDFPKAAKPTRQ